MTAPARPAAAAASEVDSAAGRKAAGETPKAAGKSASLWADSRDCCAARPATAPTRRRRPCARLRTERWRALGLAACAARVRRRPCAGSRTRRRPTLSRAACAARVRRRRPCASLRTRRRPTLGRAAPAARVRVGRRAAGWRTGPAPCGARVKLVGVARTVEVLVQTARRCSARWTHAAVLLPWARPARPGWRAPFCVQAWGWRAPFCVQAWGWRRAAAQLAARSLKSQPSPY